MDPISAISVAASVVGLVGATVKVSTLLNDFIRDVKDVPVVAHGVLQEVADIAACLTQLQAFLDGTRVGTRSRTALIMVEQVVVTLTACVMTFSELEEILKNLSCDVPTQMTGRIAWMRKESVLKRLCQRLNSSKISLNLMLTTLTCASVDQATTSVETLTSLVQQLLQNNQDLCVRLGRLESLSGDGTIPSTFLLDESDDEDDASTIRQKRHASDTILETSETSETNEIGVKRLTFEQDLRQCKVYKRVTRRHSLESLSSSTAPSFGWSCFSEMSLANVSDISVISLPIAVNELTNGEHYGRAPMRQPLLDGSEFARLGVVGPVPANKHGRIAALNPYDRITPKSIAILGTSLSGKTTVRRQMQALYGHGFSDLEREEVRASIFDNLRTASLLVYLRIGNSGIQLFPIERKNLDVLLPHKEDFWDHATLVRYVTMFRSYLSKPGICRLMHSEDWQGVNDNIEFFSRRFESLFLDDSTVADLDIFHARTASTVERHKYVFPLGSLLYQVIDHGGTYQERTKTWAKSCSNADYILFTVSLPGYCHCTPDDSAINQMLDAMGAFETVANVTEAPIILLFTKYDLLQDCLEIKPFKEHFPDYNGAMVSYDIAQYLATLFLRLDQGPAGRTSVGFVNVADPDQFRKLFSKIKSEVLE